MVDKTEFVYDLIVNSKASQDDLASLLVQVKTLQEQLAKTKTGLGGVQETARTAGRAFGSTGQSVQNASYQIADFAVQVQGGVDVSRALGQQLPQLLAGFGALGAAIGAGVAIFGPFLTSMINVGEKTKTLAQATDEAKDAFDRMQTSQSALGQTVDELREKYGSFALEIANVNTALAELDQREAFKAIQVGIGAALAQLQEVVYTAGEAGTALDEIATTGNAIASLQVTESIAQQLGLDKAELQQGVDALKDVQRNANLTAAVPAARDFIEELLRGVPAAQSLGRELSTLLGQALQLQALSKEVSSMGFSFTPQITVPDFENSGGESAVRNQLNAMEEAQRRFEAAQRAAAKTSRAASTEFDSFINTISRGSTPLQAAAFQLKQAEENLAKFQSKMTPEQLAAATAYLDGLREKMDGIGFKDKWDEMSASIESAKTPLMEFHEQLKSMGATIADNLASGLTDAFMSFIDGSKSAAEAMKDFAKQFLLEITQMIMKATILYAIQSALGMAGGGGGFGGIFSKLMGGGGASLYGGMGFAPMAAAGGISAFGAGGGAGSVVGRIIPSTPVLPRMSGGSGSNVTVNVANYTSSKVNTRQRADGGIDIEVVEAELASRIVRGGSRLDGAFSKGYGLRRQGS